MLRTTLLALILFASVAHAQEDKALADAVAKINATGASLAPVAADAKSYRFTALNVAKDFNDASLATLSPVADKLTAIDLARTKVTDAGLKSLAGMKNLTEVHLEGTAVTDAGLDNLTGLASLEYLNLYGTKVTDAGAKKLTKLAKLKALYLWQTAVTKAGAAELKKALPKTHINTGWSAEDDAKPVAVAAAAPAAAKAATDAKPAAAAPAAPAAKPAAGAPVDPAAAAKAVVFNDVILPILQDKCVSCHGAEKAKGKLRVHTFAALMKGGSDGATTVVAGKPADSLMIKRANLPKDDDDHMPPADEKQLTKEEIAVLKWWVEQGASETITVAAIKKTPDVEGILGALIKAGGKGGAAAPKVAEKPKPKPLTDAEKKAVAEVAAKMQALGASLMPLALDTEQQRLSVINAADKFGDKELAIVAAIAPHVVWIDLARSQLTDAGAATLAKFTNLERLHLENTKVTDAALAGLTGLKSLEYINLYGTKVTNAGIAKLEGNKALKKLFVWQTGVNKEGAKALEAKVPGLVVNVGLSEAEIAKLTAPPPAPPPAPAKKDDPKAKKDDPKAAKPADPAKKDAAAKPAAKPAEPAKKDEAAKPADPAKPAAKPAVDPAKKAERIAKKKEAAAKKKAAEAAAAKPAEEKKDAAK